MFVHCNPNEKISERQKHLRDAAIRSYTATQSHKRRRFHAGWNNSSSTRSRDGRQVHIDAPQEVLPRHPRSALILALHHQRDVEGVEYFLRYGVPCIAGIDDGLFWNVMVVPLVSNYECLQYVISACGIALKLWHNRQRTNRASPEERTILLESSSMALKKVMAARHASRSAVLTSCIMFIAINAIIHDYNVMQQHFRHGMAICQPRLTSPQGCQSDTETRLVESIILPIFNRLSAQLASTEVLADNTDQVHNVVAPDLCTPSSIPRFFAAREEFDILESDWSAGSTLR